MIRDFLGLVLRGFGMGSADLVPGISGGTMAFILGIYERLMEALKSLNTDAFYHLITFKWGVLRQEVDFRTLFGVGLGIILAFIVFTQFIALGKWYAAYKPQFLGFFFGMVFATVILFLWQQKTAKLLRLLTLLIGVVAGLYLTSLGVAALPDTRLYIFLSGLIAISAMLLPGISGSYILLILGKYELMLEALTQLHWPTIGIFCAGAAVGALCFVRLITFLLQKYRGTTLMFITGLIAGTLPQLWPLPYMVARPNADAYLFVGALMLGGAVFIFFLHWLQSKLS